MTHRPSWSWWLASAAIHVVVVAVLVAISGPTFSAAVRVVRFLDLTDVPAPNESRVVDLPPAGAPEPAPEPDPVPQPDTVTAPAAQPEPPAGRVEVAQGPAGGGTPGGDSAVGPAGPILAPSFESGRLWERPIHALARAAGGGDGTGVAGGAGEEEIDPATHVARVDSVVEARILAFLDTLPRDSFAIAQPAPWTTEIAGQTWGIDQSWIYLGPLKLPSALLALLPFPQGNWEQAQRARALQRIREDIMNAAWRAQSAEEFKENVRALRDRMKREREERRGGSRPDTTKSGTMYD